jgi:hypothetical protein
MSTAEPPSPIKLTISPGIFQLPIAHLAATNKQAVAAPILADLELIATPAVPSLYEHVFKPAPDAVFAQLTLPLWSQYYTADPEFLRQSQTLLKAWPLPAPAAEPSLEPSLQPSLEPSLERSMATIWADISNEAHFADKYHYIEYHYLERLNSNAKFMQIFSLYNMTSPIFSLMLPIFFLIMPFFILKMQGIPITMEKFVEILKMLFKRHQLGQLFNVANGGYDKMIYAVVSLIFYGMQVYQNITSCRKFYANMQVIHHQLLTTRTFVETTLRDMAQYEQVCASANLTTYTPFRAELLKQQAVLQALSSTLQPITPYAALSLQKCGQIGYVMKTFYDLNKHEPYKVALQYAFGFAGYLQNLAGLKSNLAAKKVAACTFITASEAVAAKPTSKKKKKKNSKAQQKGGASSCSTTTTTTTTTTTSQFVGAYFPALADRNPVKNSYSLDKHGLITGPNAAGKTTLLKTTLINILLAQQTGFGFFEAATLQPYDVVHCYINIPDTSARDSLFQAEARRCKDILTAITLDAKLRHFCVFDELYSGTNPYEAIGSAYAFLKYLNKHDNATFMITTHYLALCEKLDQEPTMQNYHMAVDTRGAKASAAATEHFTYTYKLVQGISTIKGGIKVLRDLDYPSEIIECTQRTIAKLFV